jgi:hypothetical protein
VGRVFVNVNDNLERKFNIIMSAKYGREKGVLKKCVEEAMDCWIEANKHLLNELNL